METPSAAFDALGDGINRFHREVAKDGKVREGLHLYLHSSSCRCFDRLNPFDQNERNHFHPFVGIGGFAGEGLHVRARSSHAQHFGVANVVEATAIEVQAKGSKWSRSHPR
jgi:hypothetical protein